MKIFYSILISLLCMGFVSCSEDGTDIDDFVLWDFAPINLRIDVIDSDGKSVLVPGTDNSIVGEDMTLTYGGKVYEVQWETNPYMPSRMYLARFRGFCHYQWRVTNEEGSGDKSWYLYIGEFPRDSNYTDDLKLSIRDKVYNIRIINKFSWVKKEPKIDTDISVDGVYSGEKIVLKI